MVIIGLTGSIGMGKTTVLDYLAECGVPTFNADEKVHALYQNEAVPVIAQHFPKAVVDDTVDRKILAKYVVDDPKALSELEKIVHPLVRRARKQFLKEAFANGASIAILEIPLLFEIGAEDEVDVILVVSASAEDQRARVLAREGMTEEKLEKILQRQLPDAEKRKRADYVVDTSTELDATKADLDRLLVEIANHPAKAYQRWIAEDDQITDRKNT